jgi:hypothetical protein
MKAPAAREIALKYTRRFSSQDSDGNSAMKRYSHGGRRKPPSPLFDKSEIPGAPSGAIRRRASSKKCALGAEIGNDPHSARAHAKQGAVAKSDNSRFR